MTILPFSFSSLQRSSLLLRSFPYTNISNINQLPNLTSSRISSCSLLSAHQTYPQQFVNTRRFSSKIVNNDPRRNIGVVAHVDAGKTTTCERMLYYSGIIKRCGDVDHGDTVLDFLDLERERGITIQSACITFPWKKHQFNLLDTPGHVDFTVEVERAVRCLDGAITVIDGVHGVQAQTETVWRQINRYSVPRIIFINKMDRDTASLERSIQSISSRLKIVPLQLQFIVHGTHHDLQIIDIVEKKKVIWKDQEGNNYEMIEINNNNNNNNEKDKIILKELKKYRKKLIYQLAEYNEQLMDLLLNHIYDKEQNQNNKSNNKNDKESDNDKYKDIEEGEEEEEDYEFYLSFSSTHLKSIIRKIVLTQNQLITTTETITPTTTTLTSKSPSTITPTTFSNSTSRTHCSQTCVPVLCGSGFTNRGIQLLLDSIIDYLPSPTEKDLLTNVNSLISKHTIDNITSFFFRNTLNSTPTTPTPTPTPTPTSSTLSSTPIKQSKEIEEKISNGITKHVSDFFSLVPKDYFVGLAFKVSYDIHKGMIVFVRVYHGTLKKTDILNVSNSLIERVTKLVKIKADDVVDVSELRTGDIGAIIGLKNTSTGDTLLNSKALPILQDIAKNLNYKYKDVKNLYLSNSIPEKLLSHRYLKLIGLQVNTPVFSCSVEPETASQNIPLLKALEILKQEDPSFQFEESNDLNQIIISGMGELHMQIIEHKVKTMFKIPITLGKLNIAYHTTITQSAHKDVVQSLKDRPGEFKIEISVEPNERGQGNQIVEEFSPSKLEKMNDAERTIFHNSIRSSVESAMNRGVMMGFRLSDVIITIHNFDFSLLDLNQATDCNIIERTILETLLNLTKQCSPKLLEPFMKLTFESKSEVSGVILSDLNRRRGEIQDVSIVSPTERVITALAPLQELRDYSTVLRSITHGQASYTMEFDSYRDIPTHLHDSILKQLRGY